MYSSSSRPGSSSSTSSRRGRPSSAERKKVTLSEEVQIEGLKRPMKISLPSGGPSDRAQYVEYAMDMLVHNLIGSNQLNPSKAHLVRTQEMRMHINHLADRVEAAQRAGITTQIATKHGNIPPKGTKWALQPNSLPITIITNTNPNARPRSRSQSNDRKRKNTLKVPVAIPKRSHPAPPAASQSRNTRSKSALLNKITPSSTSTSASSRRKSRISFRDELEIPITARYRSRSRNRRSALIEVLTPEEKEELQTRSFSAVENEVFKARLDMTGFTNDEIALNLKGRLLTVSGSRGKRDGLNNRKTTETLEIPDNVNLESLKVARQADGTLVIQETPITAITDV